MKTPTTRAPREEKLPKRMFKRGNKIWIRVKEEDGKWRNRPTDCTIKEVERAKRFLAATLKGIEKRAPEGIPSVTTVATYAREWLADREKRGIASLRDERGRFENHIIPRVGDVPLEQFTPRHTRDLVRALRADKEADLAPRTIHHVYQVLHNMFESAVVDELVLRNPIVIKGGEMPKKVDADREWRANATYTVEEVEGLIGDPRIPAERRVMFALKALTGMRHGEAAGLCWRHIDRTQKPLARVNILQAWDTHARAVKATKGEQIRAVPLHPELDRILTAWQKKHWAGIYGRAPTPDDYVVPARTMNPLDANDVNEAMKRDLVVLEFRLEAGKQDRSYARDRGGHDLRAWFRTRCLEDGADSMVTKRMTHAPPRDVEGSYVRYSWEVLCRELLKLKVHAPEGDPLPLVTDSLQLRKRAGQRWNVATPTGFEPVEAGRLDRSDEPFVVGKRTRANPSEQEEQAFAVTTVTGHRFYNFRALRKALSDEDLLLARAILEHIAPAR